MAQEAEEERAELVTYACKVVYIYLPLPPATSYGHRAELWDVDKWFRELRLKVVSVGDELFIRLYDQDSGELFAECPLPSDGSPLTRSVEPVVDSSRYYVLRVVDRDDPKKHAFLGLGFGARHESSAFSAALDDYRQYLRRKAEAEQMRAAFHQQDADALLSAGGAEEDAEENGAAAGGPGSAERAAGAGRYALPAGQTISIRVPTAAAAAAAAAAGGQRHERTSSSVASSATTTPSSMRTSGAGTPAPSSSTSSSHPPPPSGDGGAAAGAPGSAGGGGPRRVSQEGAGRQLMRVFSLTEGVAGVRLLPPPPPGGAAGGGGLQGPGDRALSGRSGGLADWAVFSDTVPAPSSQLLQGSGSGGSQRAGSSGTPRSTHSAGHQQQPSKGAGEAPGGGGDGGQAAAAAAVDAEGWGDFQ